MIAPLWSGLKKVFSPGDVTDVEAFLLRTQLFQGISLREIKRISPLIHYRTYDPDEEVFKKEQPGAALYIVKEGALRIVNPGDPPVVITELNPGDILGELSILDEKPRSASAITKGPTQLIAFFKGNIDDLIDSDPQIAAKLYRNLSIIIGNRLKMSNAKLKH